MKDNKTIDNVIEERRSEAHLINWIAPAILATVYAGVFAIFFGV